MPLPINSLTHDKPMITLKKKGIMQQGLFVSKNIKNGSSRENAGWKLLLLLLLLLKLQ